MVSNDLSTPADILQRFYDAETIYMAASPSERDFSGMAAHLAPDIKLHQSPDLPYGGRYEGHDGFQKWSEEMTSYFDRLDVSNPRVFEREGSAEVVVASTLKLRVRRTGKAWEQPLVQTVMVDRKKGVITEIRPFYWDVAGLNASLGK